MCAAYLSELPPPPAGKTGWPWTVETPPLPAVQPGGAPWPRLSIVTPSFNQGDFIEETIRSVLLQGYPNTEYIVMDGGSSDATVAILQKYAPFIAHWRSEPDDGQADAINKGFRLSTGDIRAYLNSDDFYLPGAFAAVAGLFSRLDCDIVVGRRQFGFNGFRPFRRSWWLSQLRPFSPLFVLHDAAENYGLPQDCVFWKADKHLQGSFDPSLQFCMDLDWFCRIFPGSAVVYTNRRLAGVNLHAAAKSAQIYRVGWDEKKRIFQRLKDEMDGASGRTEADRIRKDFAAAERRAWLRQFLPGPAPVFMYRHPISSGGSSRHRSRSDRLDMLPDRSTGH